MQKKKKIFLGPKIMNAGMRARADVCGGVRACVGARTHARARESSKIRIFWAPGGKERQFSRKVGTSVLYFPLLRLYTTLVDY